MSFGKLGLATMKKPRKKPAVVPPQGPATNLRPAGAHKPTAEKRKANRDRQDLEREIDAAESPRETGD